MAEGSKVRPGTEIVLTISKGKENTMPDLIRYSETNARKLLESKDIGLTILTEQEYSDEVKKDYIIRTEPEKGAALNYGQVVKIYVSLGRELVEVPSLTNYSPEDAIRSLEDKELEYYLTEDYSSTIPVGKVASQSPEAGTEVEKGSTVTIVVSKGKKTVKVISVIGDSESIARMTLEQLGFKVTCVEEYHATVPAGQVFDQSYPAGTELDPGSTIRLKVSKGPEPPPPTEPPTETDPPETESKEQPTETEPTEPSSETEHEPDPVAEP